MCRTALREHDEFLKSRGAVAEAVGPPLAYLVGNDSAVASFVVQAVLLVEVGEVLHVLDRAGKLSVIDERTSVGR